MVIVSASTPQQLGNNWFEGLMQASWLCLLPSHACLPAPNWPLCLRLFQAALGPSPSPDNEQLMGTINAAMVGYSSTLTASLELLGPAVLHAYKNSQDSSYDPKAVLELFGWVTVKTADTPGMSYMSLHRVSTSNL
jgi:hypothetical protein